MNTRYPRTLSGADAAFKDANYACAVERVDRGFDAWMDRICWIGAFAMFAAAMSAPYWLP